MESRDKPSWFIRIFGPIPLVIGAFCALYWFFFRAYSLLQETSSETFIFDKGSFYMLGVGVGLLALAYVCIQEFWIGKILTKKQSVILTRIAVTGVFLTFTAPHAVHYVVDSFLNIKGYSVCEEVSHQWLFVRDIVYIQQTVECSENLKK